MGRTTATTIAVAAVLLTALTVHGIAQRQQRFTVDTSTPTKTVMSWWRAVLAVDPSRLAETMAMNGELDQIYVESFTNSFIRELKSEFLEGIDLSEEAIRLILLSFAEYEVGGLDFIGGDYSKFLIRMNAIEGQPVPYVFYLVRQDDGSWRIALTLRDGRLLMGPIRLSTPITWREPES
ncbi:MAG: hypothetical protein ACE5JP_03280 [Candidatus Bipolaricaulia bacterium]